MSIVLLPPDRPLRVLFICTGNICRSPTAEVVARRLTAAARLQGRVEYDSAGTHGYHVGEAPDPRTCEAAARRGYDLSAQRARRLVAEDFERFDLLLAMDRGHLDIMRHACPPSRLDRLGLFMQHAGPLAPQEVRDPYYGGADGFDHVLDCCEDAVRGLLAALLAEPDTR